MKFVIRNWKRYRTEEVESIKPNEVCSEIKNVIEPKKLKKKPNEVRYPKLKTL